MGKDAMKMLRVIFLALAVCAATAAPSFTPHWVKPQGLLALERHLGPVQNALEKVMAVISPDKRRDSGINPQSCEAAKTVDASTLATAFGSSADAVPSTCFTSTITLLQTMCSDSCLNSKLFSRRSGRRLLGGSSDSYMSKSPSAVCTDPCFQPFMSAMIGYMTTAASTECAAAFGSSGRRLLGGASAPSAAETATLEKTIASLCVQNAAGAYCVDAFSAMDTASSSASTSSPLDTACASACSYTSGGSTAKCSVCDENVRSADCKTCALSVNSACGACVDCYKNSTNLCPLSDSEKTALSGMGCCYGTGFMLAALYDSSSTKSSLMGAAALSSMVTACGITGLTTLPCGLSGIEQAVVESTMTLTVVTIDQFGSKEQAAVVKGLASAASIAQSDIAITRVSETTRRNPGVQVNSQTTLTGAEAAKASAVQTAMSNQAAVQTAIQAADATSNVASATVATTTATNAGTVAGTPAASVSSAALATRFSAAAFLLCIFPAFICQ